MVPPQDSPTFQAVSSATPNSSILGLPLWITSMASVTTAPSTQPPETEPRNVPSSLMTRLEPAGRGAEPQVSTTVANATPRPAFCQSSAAFKISSSRSSMVDLSSCGADQAAVMRRQRPGERGDQLLDRTQLLNGGNSATWRNILFNPCAFASKAPKPGNGVQQDRPPAGRGRPGLPQ